jgi:hypothetical protein
LNSLTRGLPDSLHEASQWIEASKHPTPKGLDHFERALVILLSALRDFYIHQWHELLPAMKVSVARLALKNWPRNTELERQCVVAFEETHGRWITAVKVSEQTRV